MLNNEIKQAIVRLSAVRGYEPEAVMAFVDTESNGTAFATVDGNPEPLIRWEGHYFYKLIGSNLPTAERTKLREKAVNAGLAAPTTGAVKNPAGQQDRWDKLLKPALALDRDAAWESCSWALGQVMGANWQMLGFSSVREFVAMARSGIEGQIELMLRFIEKSGLADALKRHDWDALAHGYNGPNYKKNNYDKNLEANYHLYQPASRVEKPGDPNVTYLQQRLNLWGATLKIDGIRGKATTDATVKFQKEHDLEPDGIVGRFTLVALNAEPTEKK
jgi:hypothetical protein